MALPLLLASRRRVVNALALDVDATFQGLTLQAEPLTETYRSWVNDPASADRLGRFRLGSDAERLATRPFLAADGGIFIFSRASVAADWDAQGNLVDYPADTPRLGFDMVTRQPAGFLIEGTSTNVIANNTNSPSFATGASGNSTVLTTEIAPLFPGSVVFKHTRGDPAVSTDNNVGNIGIGSPGANQTICISCFAYVPTGFGGSSVSVGLDSSAGNIGLRGYDMAAKGTWQRIWRSVTTAAGHTGLLAAQLRPNALNGDFFYTTGWQCEVGVIPSSLIRTSGSPATCAADALRVAGDNFVKLFGLGAPTGFVIVDAVVPAMPAGTSAVRCVATMDDSTHASNRLELRPNSTNGAALAVNYNNGVQSTTPSSGIPLVFDTPARWGLRWGDGMVACGHNGIVRSYSPASGIASFDALRLGYSGLNGNYLGGRIRLAAAGPQRLTDAQFAAATTFGANVAAIVGG